MHLKQLKIAGFKSFVDPITIPFPSQLVGVVGPNGCGKSNIIDAVRWVMGESLAKHLRGESITDVIFKGSSQRKPIGQASVELIFDNQLGRISGSYASYQDISIKRVVTLDGDSSFYLNGKRCRKRDITDLFLGTGAGARGYSIIGQDTITRLIEAHPDDLRAYFEEAAGISKYKDRRRETLTRIQHTKDNLARVDDLRHELVKQLERLEIQAASAKRYIDYKHQERQCRADIVVLKWRKLKQDLEKTHANIEQWTQQLTTYQTQKHEAWAKVEALQEIERDLQLHIDHLQQQVYHLGIDLARLEETLRQRDNEQKRIQRDKQRLSDDLDAATERLSYEEQQLTLSSADAERLGAQVAEDNEQSQILQQDIELKQREELAWLRTWRELEHQSHQNERQIELDALRIQHLSERCQQLQTQQHQHYEEWASIRLEESESKEQACQNEVADAEEKHHSAKDALNDLEQHLQDVRSQLNAANDALDKKHHQLKTLTIEEAALNAAQASALSYHPTQVEHLSFGQHYPRVAELIQVSEPWVRMCEHILSDCLRAYVVDMSDWSLLSLKQQTVAMIKPAMPRSSVRESRYPRLSDMLQGVFPQWTFNIDSIVTANTLDDALACLPHLQPDESIVTPDGYWLSHDWVRVFDLNASDEDGVIARKQRIATVKQRVSDTHEEINKLTLARDELQHQRHAFERAREEKQRELHALSDALRSSVFELQQQQKHRAHSQQRRVVLQDSLDELQERLEEIRLQHEDAVLRHQNALTRRMQLDEEKAEWMRQKTWELELNDKRIQWQASKARLHQAELAHQREVAKSQQLTQSIERQTQQCLLIKERLQALHHEEEALKTPSHDAQALLAEKTKEHEQRLCDLSTCQGQRQEALEQLSRLERESKQAHQSMVSCEETLRTLHLEEQTVHVRLQALHESCQELNMDLNQCIHELPEDVSLKQREKVLHELEGSIQQLGAVNLLAIEEYQTESQRKQQVDLQYQDLTDAISTLESAIERMDNETKQRLSETFEQINAKFQQLFPRLFGGGHANLTLTCNNLLEAGIVVMAQPPGKRNSTIHMLSGGEKALTAVALVFAIFQLNPSPFCMLDEVDAPLDETNVRRFCELVREMSDVVQFLLITHNKVTMELADHLIGVTMREPGVSRIVTVNVEQYEGEN